MGDTSADLLFRISADSTPGQADLDALRGAVHSTCADSAADVAAANASMGDSLGGMHEGFHRVGQTTRETREALRGLGEEIGVTMPRFVTAWLSSLGGVSAVMAAAFAPIAVIGMIGVLEKIPGAIQKGIDWLHGWTAEAKKVFEATEHDELEWEMREIRMGERLRAIALIGKEGLDRWHVAAAINSQDYEEVKNKLAELNEKLIENAAIAATPMGAKALMGETDLSKLEMGPTSQQIEQAKLNVKQLEPIIKVLSDMLDELGVKGKETIAETGAALKELGKKQAEEGARLAQEVAAQSAQIVVAEGRETLAAKLAAWDAEITARALAMAREKTLTAANYEALVELWRAHSEVLRAEQARTDRERAEHIAEENARISEAWLRELIEGFKKRDEAEEAAAKKTAELRERLAALTEKSLEDEHRALDAKINLEIADLKRENKATAEVLALEEEIRKAGHAKIDADNAAAYAQEMARLDEHLKSIERRDETTQERIVSAYRADTEKINAEEEKETQNKALNEAQRAAIAAKYAAIRAALLGKEQTELQALKNSQGWRGVFGSEFAEMIRGNEALLKEWAQSSDQAAMLLRVTFEGLKETAEKTFQSMAAGMAANIATAVIHTKSVKAAMKEEEEAVLESLASQAAVHAISCLALGFERLAQYEPGSASQAFTAAAIWGSVAVAAAVAGRAVAGAPAGGATGTGAGGAGEGRQALKGAVTGPPAARTAAGQGGPHVTVNVQGHLVGWANINELTGAISDAVLNSDANLTATATKTGVQLTK
jgi:hypothetical protein